MKILQLRSCILALMIMGGSVSVQAATFYVKASAPNGGNGSSWSKAFNNLDLALNAARANGAGADQIWIAKGTYKPTQAYSGNYTGTEPNLKTFNLPTKVSLYGGFVGNETELSKRNPDQNPTILSGDLAGNDVNTPSTAQSNKSDNAWHVLSADGVTGVTLDGLSVINGYAAGPDSGTLGRGFVLATLDYVHDSGGGLLAMHEAKVTLNNMKFSYNTADATRASAALRGPVGLGRPALAAGGGAIAAVHEETLVTINNSTFTRNTALNLGSNGGALSALLEASFTVSTSSFTDNVANRIGGAIHGKDAENIKITASLLKNNTMSSVGPPDQSGGGLGVVNTNVSVAFSIFDGNASGPIAGGGGIIFHIPFDDGEAYTLDVDNSLFIDNRGAAIGGGAINIFGIRPHVGSKASISNSLFTNNVAGVGGAVVTDSIPTLIDDSIFTGNNAWVNGGAIFGSNFGDAIFGANQLADRTKLTVSNSLFALNSIIGIPPDAPPPVVVFDLFASFNNPAASVTTMSPGGGAIATELAGNVSISKCIFTGNRAPNGSGGAVLTGGTAGTPLGMNQAFTTLSQSAFFANTAMNGNNTAVLNPGGLSCTSNGVQLILNGVAVCP